MTTSTETAARDSASTTTANPADKLTTGLAGEFSHWYDTDGRPRYQIPAKNGDLRNVTLRDARKFNLVPSVTKIIKEAAAPSLEWWKRDQLLTAAATWPVPKEWRNPKTGDLLPDFVKPWMEAVTIDSKAQATKARERGTQIHEEIEFALKGGITTEFAAPVLRWLKGRFPDALWQPERSFASAMGYGGKLDLYTPGVILDFKTKDFGRDDDIGAWDEQGMQLAAYAIGLGEDLGRVQALNLFISTSEPDLLVAVIWTAEDLSRCWKMFDCLLTYWQVRNKYESGFRK